MNTQFELAYVPKHTHTQTLAINTHRLVHSFPIKSFRFLSVVSFVRLFPTARLEPSLCGFNSAACVCVSHIFLYSFILVGSLFARAGIINFIVFFPAVYLWQQWKEKGCILCFHFFVCSLSLCLVRFSIGLRVSFFFFGLEFIKISCHNKPYTQRRWHFSTNLQSTWLCVSLFPFGCKLTFISFRSRSLHHFIFIHICSRAQHIHSFIAWKNMTWSYRFSFTFTALRLFWNKFTNRKISTEKERENATTTTTAFNIHKEYALFVHLYLMYAHSHTLISCTYCL